MCSWSSHNSIFCRFFENQQEHQKRVWLFIKRKTLLQITVPRYDWISNFFFHGEPAITIFTVSAFFFVSLISKRVFLSIFPEISSKSWGSLGTKRKIDLYFADGFFCQMPMKFAKEKRDRMCGDHPYLCKISPRKLPDGTGFENRSKMIILIHCALQAKNEIMKNGSQKCEFAPTIGPSLQMSIKSTSPMEIFTFFGNYCLLTLDHSVFALSDSAQRGVFVCFDLCVNVKTQIPGKITSDFKYLLTWLDKRAIL